MLEQSPVTQGEMHHDSTLLEVAAEQLGSLCLRGGKVALGFAVGMRGVVNVAGDVLKEIGRSQQLLNEEVGGMSGDTGAATQEAVIDWAEAAEHVLKEHRVEEVEGLEISCLENIIHDSASVLQQAEEGGPELQAETVEEIRELSTAAVKEYIERILRLEQSSVPYAVPDPLVLLTAVNIICPEDFEQLLPIVAHDVLDPNRRGYDIRVSDLVRLLAGTLDHPTSAELELVDELVGLAELYAIERATKRAVGVGDGSTSV